MALRLRNELEWVEHLNNTSGLQNTQSTTYPKIFHDNRISDETLSELSKQDLNDLGITVLGDVLAIIKKCRVPTPNTTPVSQPLVKPLTPKLPELHSEMTLPQLRKFKVDWEAFKKITQLPDDQIASQLYNACKEAVQISLSTSTQNLFERSEEELLKLIESIITQKSNLMVHRMSFTKLTQG